MKKTLLTIAATVAIATTAQAGNVNPEQTYKFDSYGTCIDQWKNAVMKSKDPYWNTVDFDETGTPKMGDKFQYPVMKTFYVRGDTKASMITQSCKQNNTIWQYSYPEFISNMSQNKG